MMLYNLRSEVPTNIYGKHNRLLVSYLYKIICEDIPYQSLRTIKYKDHVALISKQWQTIYGSYFPYKGKINISIPISIMLNGEECLSKNGLIFHKNAHNKFEPGWAARYIILKRMIPLLGKVKRQNGRTCPF